MDAPEASQEASQTSTSNPSSPIANRTTMQHSEPSVPELTAMLCRQMDIRSEIVASKNESQVDKESRDTLKKVIGGGIKKKKKVYMQPKITAFFKKY